MSEKDQIYFKQHPYTIAKTWRQNIKKALPESTQATENDAFIAKNESLSNSNSFTEKQSLDFHFFVLIFVMILSLLIGIIFFILYLSKQKIQALKRKLMALEKQ